MPDPDMVRYQEELRNTLLGKKLVAASRSAKLALENSRQFNVKNQEIYRRAYIAACNRASEIIEAMVKTYDWPPMAEHAKDFVWKPKAPSP